MSRFSIATIPRCGGTEEARVSLIEISGEEMTDVRVFVRAPDGKGMVPTEEGLLFDRDQLPQLVFALRAAMFVLGVREQPEGHA